MPQFIQKFPEPERERAYRLRNYAARQRDIRTVLIATSVIYAMTVLEHIPQFGALPAVTTLVGLRVSILALATIAIVSINRSLDAPVSRVLLFVYMTAIGLSEAYEQFNHVSAWSHGSFPVIVIVVLSFYFFVRYDLHIQVAAGIFVSVIYTGSVFATQPGPIIGYSGVALLFLLVNGIGFYHFASSETRDRREFRLLLEERSLNRRLKEERAINESLFQELRHRSMTDYLTGLVNRGAFEEELDRHHALAIRHERPLSLILLDLDRFKQINDRFGHPTGDTVLRSASDVLRNTARGGDIPGRLGGDELGIILPETGNEGATAIAVRVLDALRNTSIREDLSVNVRASLGVATLHDGESVESFWERADRALYQAKIDGRDRVYNCDSDLNPAQYATI